MPSRNRSDAALTEPETAATPAPTGELHTEQTPKVLSGKLVDSPTMNFSGSGKVVTRYRLEEDAPEGERGQRWTVSMWGRKAEKAAEALREGDHVKAIGRWEPDWEGPRGTSTHQHTAFDVGVYVGDDLVPIDKFDRSALTEPPPALEVVKGESLASGGVSAAD